MDQLTARGRIILVFCWHRRVIDEYLGAELVTARRIRCSPPLCRRRSVLSEYPVAVARGYCARISHTLMYLPLDTAGYFSWSAGARRRPLELKIKAVAAIRSRPGRFRVGTAEVQLRPMAQHLTVSSELVPFQEIDVYAKEAGYVKQLNVDYGSHVRAGTGHGGAGNPGTRSATAAGPGGHQSAKQRSHESAE